MFNPHQVQEWRRLAQHDEDVKSCYLGHRLGSADLWFEPTADRPSPKRIEIGTSRLPSEIFGTPTDASCMNGIWAAKVYARRPERMELRDSRVVGNTSILAADGRLFTPGDAHATKKDAFLEQNSWGHQGFLLEDLDDHVKLRFIEREKPRYYDMDAIFLQNIEPANFGSFMFRQLAQMVAAREAGGPCDAYITSERTTFFLEALEMLGLPRRPVFTVREVAGERFRSIAIFRLDDAEGFIPPDLLNQCRSLAQEMVQTHGRIDVSPQIYVSRALSAMRQGWYRVMQNEDAVEETLRSRGFTIVYPETLSLKDQARTFLGARRIIGPSGSGMFNMMFAEQPERVVDIETFHITVRQHAKLYSSCGADYSFLFAPFAGGESQPPMTRPSVCPSDLLDRALHWLQTGAG